MYICLKEELKPGFSLSLQLLTTLKALAPFTLLFVLRCDKHQHVITFTSWKTANLYWLIVLAEGGGCYGQLLTLVGPGPGAFVWHYHCMVQLHSTRLCRPLIGRLHITSNTSPEFVNNQATSQYLFLHFFIQKWQPKWWADMSRCVIVNGHWIKTAASQVTSTHVWNSTAWWVVPSMLREYYMQWKTKQRDHTT